MAESNKALKYRVEDLEKAVADLQRQVGQGSTKGKKNTNTSPKPAAQRDGNQE